MDAIVEAPADSPRSPFPPKTGSGAHGAYYNCSGEVPLYGNDAEEPDDYVIPNIPPPSFMARSPRTPKTPAAAQMVPMAEPFPYDYAPRSPAGSVTSAKAYAKRRDDGTKKTEPFPYDYVPGSSAGSVTSSKAYAKRRDDTKRDDVTKKTEPVPYDYVPGSSAGSVTSSKAYAKRRDDVAKKTHNSFDYANYVRMAYSIDEMPPWYLTLLLGFQHYLIMFGATVANPVVLSDYLCIAKDDYHTKSQLVSTIFVVSGICTLLQTTIGVRLPLVQGGTFIFVVPSIAILSLPQWKCPTNITSVEAVANYTAMNHLTEPLWKPRIREIQGAILVAGTLEFFLGITGVMGFMVRFIGPLSIAPTITLAGLALFNEAARKSSTQWWITLVTVILIVAFSQYTKNIRVPCCKFRRGQGFVKENIAIFRLFPVILAVCLTWIICAILTAANVFSSTAWQGAKANLDVGFLRGAPWYNFPYPGQWGTPTVTSAGVIGMFAGVLASMFESIGDYYACARLARLPSPPIHALNRGLTIEGLGCILAGAFGTSSGTTTYSENIGAIGITKVASRRVFQVSASFMILFGVFSKFGAIFATIPEPVTGGVFIVMFGMIAAVGLSNLQFVDLNSSRNLFIIGFSLFFGLTLPPYIASNSSTINTGSQIADQIIIILLSTNMFVGGLAGFVLDNTIPGTREERGMNTWRKEFLDEEPKQTAGGLGNSAPGDSSLQLPTMGHSPLRTYDIPMVSHYLKSRSWAKYIPILPSFDEDLCVCCGKEKKRNSLKYSSGRAQSREAMTQL